MSTHSDQSKREPVGMDIGSHEAAALRCEMEALKDALREIRDQDWVENALDPQRSSRVAAVALGEETVA